MDPLIIAQAAGLLVIERDHVAQRSSHWRFWPEPLSRPSPLNTTAVNRQTIYEHNTSHAVIPVGRGRQNEILEVSVPGRRPHISWLYSCDGVPFKLHKLALVARSPVMREAWKIPEVEMVDGAPREVAEYVRQFPHGALKNFFYTLYTGLCDISMDRLTEFHHFCTDIYRLAHRFQVEDIMDMSYFLMRNRKFPSNAVEIYLLALEVKNETLSSDAERYIVSRRRDVMKSEAWMELKSQKAPAYTELLEAMALA